MKYVEGKASEMESLSITTKTVKPNSVKLDKEERARISAQVTDYLEQTRILAGRVPFATIGGRRREGEQPEGEDAPCTYTLPPRPGAKPGAGRKARAQGKDGGSREKERSRKQRREYDPVVVAVLAAFLAAITLLFVRSDGLIAVALILAALFVGYRLSCTNE